MKKLFASASYSFNNFYNNLNMQGQMVFTLIMALIFILCVILFMAYILEGIKNKAKIYKIKKETTKIKKQEEIKNNNLNQEKTNVEEKKEDTKAENTTNIEDIANAISDALKEEAPISLTNFEEDQEKTAIISIDELMAKAKELELIDDEDSTGINYLEKYNLDPAEVEEAVSNTVKPNKDVEVKAFKVSQVISPIYGVKKDVLNDKEA